jgi:hypothetical protein
MSAADQAIKAIDEALSDLAALGDPNDARGEEFYTFYTRLDRWQGITAQVLREVVSNDEAAILLAHGRRKSPPDTLEGQVTRARAFLTGLKADIARNPARVLKPVVPASADTDIKLSREGVFFKGQHFDAMRFVGRVLSQATASILIVDGYPGEALLGLLAEKGASVTVRILTKPEQATGKLKTLVDAFNKQHGGLSVRASAAFHDRFVVVDDRDFYHFGASLKDVGSKGFMFSVIEEPAVVAAVRQAVEEDWDSATPIV